MRGEACFGWDTALYKLIHYYYTLKGIVPGHLAEPDQLIPLDCCEQWFMMCFQCIDRAPYKVIGFYIYRSSLHRNLFLNVWILLSLLASGVHESHP